jgi:uracil-DNA glycosylase
MLDKNILFAYFRQQKQLSMPGFVFGHHLDLQSLLGNSSKVIEKKTTTSRFEIKETVKNILAISQSAAQKKDHLPISSDKQSLASRLSSLKTVEQLGSSIKPRQTKPKSVESVPTTEKSKVNTECVTFDQKRAALRMLYYAGCENCPLSQTRKTFVFGAGVANAPVMVIGDAPGGVDDEQGLPFVGSEAQLLTSMLNAIDLDRNKNIFITNVLKCRPPEDRSPQRVEIVACLPILAKQITIIRPKALLILGRVAAHSVLGLTDTLAGLRSRTHHYMDIPSMVIYHPAALLRNPEFKRPAWEDLQKFQLLLADLGVYELSKQ